MTPSQNISNILQWKLYVKIVCTSTLSQIFFLKYNRQEVFFIRVNIARLMNFKLKINISLHYSLCDSQSCLHFLSFR